VAGTGTGHKRHKKDVNLQTVPEGCNNCTSATKPIEGNKVLLYDNAVNS
jgi:hypothetical protein